MLETPPKAARSGPKSTSLSETTLSDDVGRGQPVEKVAIEPVGKPNRVLTLRNHDQNTAAAVCRVRKGSSEAAIEEFFNRLGSSANFALTAF